MYHYSKRLQAMINYDDVIKEKINKHNPDWRQILHYPYRILIIGGSGPGKTNALRNLIKQQYDDNYNIIDKSYLCVKDSNKAKYQYLINKYEDIGLEKREDPKSFIEYSNNMQNVYKKH